MKHKYRTDLITNYNYKVGLLHQGGQTAHTGVYLYNDTEVDVAQTLVGLSNMTNLPAPYRRHEVLQMLDGTVHADTDSGKRNINSNAEGLHFHADHDGKQKKRKRGDEAARSQLKQHPTGIMKHQQCTEAIRKEDRHRPGQIMIKIKVGNRLLGTKAIQTPSLIQQILGACSSDTNTIVPLADSVMKQSFTSHARIPFSVLQLLSAVRMALIVQFATGTGKGSRRDIIRTGQVVKRSRVPHLTIHEIVERVRRRPGDPRILKTEVRLQDLVNGVLNTLSSQTALSGVKGWKGLTAYDTSTKCWYWIGPLPSKFKFTAWDISPAILPELIDYFAKWMRQQLETLRID